MIQEVCVCKTETEQKETDRGIGSEKQSEMAHADAVVSDADGKIRKEL